MTWHAATQKVANWTATGAQEVLRWFAGLLGGNPGTPPLADYDSMSEPEITRSLPSLRPPELCRVEAYERTQLARPAILEAVEREFQKEPWPGYQMMLADEIVPKLVVAPRATFEYAIAYERHHLNRPTIIYS